MKARLSSLQLQKLSDILVVVGEVLFATVVVPFFLKVDGIDINVVYSGWILTVVSWFTAIMIVGRIK